MLQVENLTKIYKRGKHEVKALNNVSFTLPDNGFIFITGKSGCGKSTMLNLIGGLDNTTSGDIICDGNRLSEFNLKDFDNYRNAYLGFVFQDFHLIDDLNVYQNIELSISLLGKKYEKDEEEKMIDQALSIVDLEPKYKSRFVGELSGGQKQRVAIARALVKNPKLILADEPTGNLDSKTSKKILEVLKKLSQDRLVIIVSHNLDDAKKYADRIIELADGEIVSDTTRSGKYAREASLEKGTLTLPYCQALTPREVKNINENLSQGNIKKIKQSSSGFVTTKQKNIDVQAKTKIDAGRLSFKKSLGLAGYFSRKRLFPIITTTIITSLLIVVLGLCQFFIKFDTGVAISSAIANSDEKYLVAHKGYYDDDGNLNNNYLVNISDEELEEFSSSEYSGNIYPIYDNGVVLTSGNCDAGYIAGYRNFRGLYLTETIGTLQCNTEFLENNFASGNDIEVLAGELDKYPYGLIVTDYIADAMLSVYGEFKNNKSYEALVEAKNIAQRMVINAVIKTDYKEKYADLFKYYSDIEQGIDRSADEETMKENVRNFILNVRTLYGLTYSINPNFQEDIKSKESSIITNVENTVFVLPNGNIRKVDVSYLWQNSTVIPLEENEITMEYDMYNTIFGRVYGYYDENTYENFTPITVTLQERSKHDDSIIIATHQVTIPALKPDSKSTTEYICCGDSVYQTFHSVETRPYALYFDDSISASHLYSMFTDKAYSIQSTTYYSISSIGSIVEIFEDFFGLIVGGLLIISTLLIVSNAYRNIKKKYYEIGVLKALGAKTSDVGFIFSMQTILTGVVVSILSTLSLAIFCTPINNSILSALMEHFHNDSIAVIEILKFYPITMLINIIFVLFATTLSCLMPIVMIHRIKPNAIMKKDE